jgi:TPR repeat protein
MNGAGGPEIPPPRSTADVTPIFAAPRSDIDLAFHAFNAGDLSSELGNRFQAFLRRGDFLAAYCLGCMYEDGTNGLPRDIDKALECYVSAAEATGMVDAWLAVARFHLLGRTGYSNWKKAFDCYAKLAAEASPHPVACLRLGRMYQRGEGTDVDLERSRRWLARAAGLGSLNAMIYLFRLELRKGRPWPAVRWYVRMVRFALKLKPGEARDRATREW